ncbi:MAG: DUF4838 domain-containing protein [Verrucomicrobiota bacterium]
MKSLIPKVNVLSSGIVLIMGGLMIAPYQLKADEMNGERFILLGKERQHLQISHSNETDSGGNPLVQYAAQDLQRYLKGITGYKPIIRDDSELEQDEVAVHIGRTGYINSLRLGLDDLAPDGFIIAVRYRADKPQVIIAGRTPLATYYGVNQFLRKYAGVRWLFPGELGEVIPERENINIPVRLENREESYFLPRRRFFGSAEEGAGIFNLRHMIQSGQVKPGPTNPHGSFSTQLPHKYESPQAQHEIRQFLPLDLYDEHPEYFPLIDGERQRPESPRMGWQPCMSNPEVVQLAIDAAREHFDENPDSPGFSLGENDGRGYCRCEDCRKLDTDKRRWATDLARNYANRKWWFYVQVAEAIKESHPDRKIVVFGYLRSSLPPDDPEIISRIPDNIIVQKTFGHESDQKKLQEWSKLGVAISGWDYLNYNDTFTFRHFPHQWQQEMRWRRDRGMQHYVAELHPTRDNMNPQRLNPQRWIMQRLLWNLEQDVDALMQEYCQAAYGAAAEPMREFWDRWEEIYMRRPEKIRRCFMAYAYRHEWSVDFQLQHATLEDLAHQQQRLDRAFALVDDERDRERLELVREAYEEVEPPMIAILKLRRFAEQIDAVADADKLISRMSDLKRALEEQTQVYKDEQLPLYIPGDSERELDKAADRVTELLTESLEPLQAQDWWEEVKQNTPELSQYAGSQIYQLRNPDRKNLLENDKLTANKEDDSRPDKWRFSGSTPELAEGRTTGQNAVKLGEFVKEEDIAFSAAMYQDVQVEAGNRYRAKVHVKNLIDNVNRRAWADKARLQLEIVWLKKNQPLAGQPPITDRLWENQPEWYPMTVSATAPKEADAARVRIQLDHYLDERNYLDLDHGEFAVITEPEFKRIGP